MSHPRDRDLALWAGGDLPAGEAERIAEHLSACPACRALADGLRASRDGLESLGAEPVDPAALVRIRDGVRRRLAEETAPAGWSAGRSRTALWPWALAAALALAALGLGIWYRTAGTGEPERLARAERPEPAEVVREAPPPPPKTPEERAETPPESPGPEAAPQTGRRPEPATRPDEAAPPPPEPSAPVQRAALPTQPMRPTEPTVIKVVSDDPDIVYYWLVEPEESEDESVSS